MKKIVKVPVVGAAALVDARTLVAAGRYSAAAEVIRGFCWSNPTLQGEGGEMWGTLSLAALRLVGLASGDVDGAQRIIGEVWKRVVPGIKEVGA